MFDELRERILNILTSRITVLTVIFLILGGILIYRCFDLQIVNGQEYLDEFILKTEKTRTISSTRGRILDRNGVVLADNELAYSVKIEDVYESGMSSVTKNQLLNENIYKLIKMIEKNGDSVITDFNVVIDENGEFAFNVEGTKRLRFLADIYGESYIDDLEEDERNATADDVIEYLGGKGSGGFRIGDYEIEGDSNSKFIVGKGYTKEELLQLVTIRYAMRLTSYRKYVGTTVAKDVSEETVAVVMENMDQLVGVTIEEDTARRYYESEYFAQLLGYTGKISSDELTELNAREEENGGDPQRYTVNDVVGKSGIEAYMESTLQGTKGSEKLVVDNLGKTIMVKERTEPEAGEDVWLTIDSDLQMASYQILEQGIAGILKDKIINAKEYNASEGSSNKDIKIPIYDVYYAIINNSVVDITHFEDEDAGEKEKQVYAKFLQYRDSVYEKLRTELMTTKTPYNKLSKEYQVYQSNIVSLLYSNGVIDSDKVDKEDATYLAWTKEEVISLNEYLNYCIGKSWVDVSKLDLEEKYIDSEATFEQIVEYIINMIDGNAEFRKKFYKYMLLNDVINGRDICMLICEQKAADYPAEEEEKLYNGTLSAYQFMMNRITNLEITPAQLALDPCNGAVVITDVKTGDVLAMVTYPGYDNNKLANTIDAKYWAKLMTDKSSPSLNYATQYKAAPGSTFKMLVAAAGLCEGIIDLSSQTVCTGVFKTIENGPKCWKTWGHGSLNVVGAIQNSCNVFFYDLGYKLSSVNGTYDTQAGLNTLAKYADMFGLSEKSGVEVEEYSPEVSDIDPVRTAIGQGSGSYTTVGLARYVTTVANGGTCYNLTLLDKVTDADGTVLEEYEPDVRNTVDMPIEYWNAIHLGMRKVVEGKSYFSDLAVNVAGKTGTAEQIKSRSNHALFVGYAPYEEPEIAFAVRIPFGYSSDYAAQVAREIIKYYYGLAAEEDILTGTADMDNEGVSINEF